jgi:hypothetical protein
MLMLLVTIGSFEKCRSSKRRRGKRRDATFRSSKISFKLEFGGEKLIKTKSHLSTEN